MTTLLRVVLIAGLAASLPPVAAGQKAPDDALLRRIEILERRSMELERRVRELENVIKSEPTRARPVVAAGNALDIANWRRLRTGMKMDEVRALLGEPERVDGGGVAFWHWGDASVTFMDDKLYSWSEPRT
jgi:hypothetical protein